MNEDKESCKHNNFHHELKRHRVCIYGKWVLDSERELAKEVQGTISDKLILLKRNNPIEYEIHRYEIRQKRNLVLTTTDSDFAHKLVNAYNHYQ